MSIRNLTENIANRPEILLFRLVLHIKYGRRYLFLNQVNDLINIQDNFEELRGS